MGNRLCVCVYELVPDSNNFAINRIHLVKGMYDAER